MVIILKTNGNTLIDMLPIDNEMVYLKETDTYHVASTDFVGTYTQQNKQYPVIILPEWSLKPLKRHELFKETIENKELANPQRVIINAIKMAQLKPKSMLGGSSMIWIILGICVALYFVYQMFTGGTV